MVGKTGQERSAKPAPCACAGKDILHTTRYMPFTPAALALCTLVRPYVAVLSRALYQGRFLVQSIANEFTSSQAGALVGSAFPTVPVQSTT